MRPGEGKVILVLDKQREIKALEAGIVSAVLAETDFGHELFEAGHEADYQDCFDGKEYGPPWKRAIEPELAVTSDNVEQVRVAALATIAQGGLINVLLGRRRTAKKIIRNI